MLSRPDKPSLPHRMGWNRSKVSGLGPADGGHGGPENDILCMVNIIACMRSSVISAKKQDVFLIPW